MSHPDRPWSVPFRIEDVPEQGRTVDLEADAATREAVAKASGVDGIDQLEAHFDLSREGSEDLRVAGRVNATVRQTCVVTLDPLTNRIEEPIDLVFTLRQGVVPEDQEDATRTYVEPEPPEPLVDGTVDLGAVATEFLILGIDPYPRKPGAVFAAPEGGDEAAHPFAALAALKKKGGHVKE